MYWLSQLLLILIMPVYPWLAPNFRRKEDDEPFNLQEVYEKKGIMTMGKRFLYWLLEKNMAHFKPFRFLMSQFLTFGRSDLSKFEMTYMTWG